MDVLGQFGFIRLPGNGMVKQDHTHNIMSSMSHVMRNNTLTQGFHLLWNESNLTDKCKPEKKTFSEIHTKKGNPV
jgi:hypothetical protein